MKISFIKYLILIVILGTSQIALAQVPEVAPAVEQAATQSEMMGAVMKFVTVMIGVMLSSLAIFIGLSVWNSLLNRSRKKVFDYEATLKEPHSVDEAILLFIQKNKLK